MPKRRHGEAPMKRTDKEVDEMSRSERAVKRPRVCVYQTGIEPLNRLVTEFVNSGPKDEPKHNSLDMNILHRMVRRIQKAGNCPILSDVVPKDRNAYELWLADVVHDVNTYVRTHDPSGRTDHLDMQSYLGPGFDAFIDGEEPEDFNGVNEDPDAAKRRADALKAAMSSMAKAISEAIASGEMPDGDVEGDDSGDAVGVSGSDDGRDGDEDEPESLTGKKDVPSPRGSEMSDLAVRSSVKRIRLNGDLAMSGDDDDGIEVLYDGSSPPAKDINEDTDSDIKEVPPAEPKVDASADSTEEVATVEVQPLAGKAENTGDVVEKAIVANVPEVSPAVEGNGDKENGSSVA